MTLSKIKRVVDNNDVLKYQQEAAYDDDIWELSAVGIKPPPYIRVSYLSFQKVNPR